MERGLGWGRGKSWSVIESLQRPQPFLLDLSVIRFRLSLWMGYELGEDMNFCWGQFLERDLRLSIYLIFVVSQQAIQLPEEAKTQWQMAVPRLGNKLHVFANRTSQISREVIIDGQIRPGVLEFVFNVDWMGNESTYVGGSLSLFLFVHLCSP